MLPVEQKIFFYSVAFLLFALTLLMARRNRLRENYVLLWLFVSLSLILVVVKYDWLVKFSDFFGANPTSMVMFLGMVALLLMVLQLSLMNSSQATQLKNLAQKTALLEKRLDDKKK